MPVTRTTQGRSRGRAVAASAAAAQPPPPNTRAKMWSLSDDFRDAVDNRAMCRHKKAPSRNGRQSSVISDPYMYTIDLRYLVARGDR